MAKAGPTKGLVDQTLRTGRHELFLRIYNKSVCSKKKSKISKLLTGISNYGITFLLFLIFCAPISGAASKEANTIEFHVIQEVENIDEIYNIFLKKGWPRA